MTWPQQPPPRSRRDRHTWGSVVQHLHVAPVPTRLQLQLAAVAVRDAVRTAHGRELVGAAWTPAQTSPAGRHALAAVRTHAVSAYAVGTWIYKQKAPACSTLSSLPSRQAARFNSHSLSCVRESEPQTGRSTGSQAGGQAHTAPPPSTRHSAPCRHSTSAQGFTPGRNYTAGFPMHLTLVGVCLAVGGTHRGELQRTRLGTAAGWGTTLVQLTHLRVGTGGSPHLTVAGVVASVACAEGPRALVVAVAGARRGALAAVRAAIGCRPAPRTRPARHATARIREQVAAVSSRHQHQQRRQRRAHHGPTESPHLALLASTITHHIFALHFFLQKHS